MSLYRRGRLWWIELTSNGRRIREPTGTADKKAAQEYHEKRKSEIWRQAKLGEPEPVTWGEAVAMWLKIKPRSLPERYMIGALGIKPRELLPLATKRLNAALTVTTAGSWNRYMSLVSAIHNCAGTTISIKKRPNPPGRVRWLTAEEWDRLRPAIEEESPLLHDCAVFSIETGLRENNVLNLEWNQVDLRRRVAMFSASQMKGGVAHGISLNGRAMAVLRSRIGLHERYVFANPNTGAPMYRASNKHWYQALKKAKIHDFHWHDLRHTWASWHVMNGTDLYKLQRLGAWKDFKSVQRYAHLAPEHLADAAENVKPVSLRPEPHY
jgi:integrase